MKTLTIYINNIFKKYSNYKFKKHDDPFQKFKKVHEKRLEKH